MQGLVCARSKACCDKTGVTWTSLCTVLCCDFRVLSHSLLTGTTSIGKVCQCVGVTIAYCLLSCVDQLASIYTHLSTPFSTPAGTIGRGSQFVGLETSIYAYSTLLSTIFTLTEFMFKSVVKPMSPRATQKCHLQTK